jgi:ribosome-associated toxin RatA of RatAB toxin-antitoxin module
MRHVEIHGFIPGAQATTAFNTLADFNRYSHLVDVVRSVDLHRPNGPETAYSDWVVEFRGGLLCWREEDWFDAERLRLDFRQTEGDFDEFFGGWQLEQTADGVRTALIADFDFGVPSLASIIEPVAERVLTDVTRLILTGLFGPGVSFHENLTAA